MILKNFKESREIIDIKQKDIAEFFNINFSTVSGWETGKDTIPIRRLIEYANHYNFSLDYLFGLTRINKEYYPVTIDIEHVAKNLRLCGVTIEDRQHKPKFNENIFDNIDTEEKAYWLGFIFADGYIETQKPNMKYSFEICLSCKDKHHLEKFNIFMQHKNMNIKVYTHLDKIANKERTNARWIVANKHLWNTLNNLGCTPQKSLTLKLVVQVA